VGGIGGQLSTLTRTESLRRAIKLGNFLSAYCPPGSKKNVQAGKLIFLRHNSPCSMGLRFKLSLPTGDCLTRFHGRTFRNPDCVGCKNWWPCWPS
jgi:hypothetical protein